MSETAAGRVEEAASRFSKFVVIVFAISVLHVADFLDRHPWVETAVVIVWTLVVFAAGAWIMASV